MAGMDYADSPYPVRADLAAAHAGAWERLSKAGTWLTAEERVAVMAETRNAADCAFCDAIKEALSPFSVPGAHDSLGCLPDNWVDVIHRVVADPGRLTRGWYERALESGIADTHFVEIVSVVAHATAIDTFAKGLGIPLRDLPEAAGGEPRRYRPKEARQHEAWAPNIAWDEHGPGEADYFVGPAANIRRALTLVPDEARSFFAVASAQYLAGPQMRDFSREFRAITHGQIELVAARVSALNRCTY